MTSNDNQCCVLLSIIMKIQVGTLLIVLNNGVVIYCVLIRSEGIRNERAEDKGLVIPCLRVRCLMCN